MDHEIMTKETAAKRGLIKSPTKPAYYKPLVPDINIITLGSVAIMREFIERLNEPSTIQNLPVEDLFHVWVKVDEELQRRAEPTFEPLHEDPDGGGGVSNAERMTLADLLEDHTQLDVEELREMALI